MTEFKIKPYTKLQLAQLYFPNSTELAARQRLLRWIDRCKPLRQSLEQANYCKFNHWFTPQQVRIIVEYLGEPGV